MQDQEEKPRKRSPEFLAKLDRAVELADMLYKQLENWGKIMEKAQERQLPTVDKDPESDKLFTKIPENKDAFTGVKRREQAELTEEQKAIYESYGFTDERSDKIWRKRMEEALGQKSVIIPNGLSREEVREFILKNAE